ncbi:MAG: hypothetical protein OEV44_05140 [Spirochaetota bacterium]|nr:hypothetical protein [Spirochaetota bacterium]
MKVSVLILLLFFSSSYFFGLDSDLKKDKSKTQSESKRKDEKKSKVIYHKMKRGDTLYKIALKYYGKKSYVKKLYIFKSVRLKRMGKNTVWVKPSKWMYGYSKWLPGTLIKIPAPVYVDDKDPNTSTDFKKLEEDEAIKVDVNGK